ncbi:TetR/AcrR family transcriptional regulator [Aeromonas schubertii]|uniref:TetR/AcrR family transcriptional regulator n=2 Tax=Aeromonas schubertii TaxID=652 RepID=A0ABS7VGJ2_9GAMM|nr:TetR/AcrR family transcriptional regulator [Aeromonas schubertii]KUE78162.1 TetR family transcriptional regulator [Aeromonas schubertii]MBZ6068073.1 TetR/AcrR family transcriptional regulator [Aeromonas schubertii]MBZ6073803.1 TetR/AcrR family transcriptional regulator [Aeromonas schubertii]QCG49574.1 TetR/AcrR family transcriptional regulator [Aeromonas schubertii]
MEKRRPGRPVGRSDIRDKLLSAARECFRMNPYSKVTTREIAELAGSNLAMIHYYFGSKEGLYQAVLGELTEPLDQVWRDECSQRSLEELVATHYQVMGPEGELNTTLTSALAAESSPGREFVLNQLISRQLPQFDQLIEQMEAKGELDQTLDPTLLRLSFLNLMWQPLMMREMYEKVFGVTMDEGFMSRLAQHNCRLISSGLRGAAAH